MLYFICFILGALFTICLTKGTINIKVHHIQENLTPPVSDEDLDDAYKTMQEPDTELDKLYETMGEVKDIMEGSDRIDG